MSELEPDQETASLADYRARLGKYALFDEVIDFALDGQCTLDEAVAQFQHDLHDIGPDGSPAA